MPRKKIDTIDAWLRRIFDRKRLAKIRNERAEGKINAPIRGIRGLANLVAKMNGTSSTIGHRWECECKDCRPWLWRGDDKVATDRTLNPRPEL